MNAFVTGSGLPPVIAMVLDQAPRLDGPGRTLALAAEQTLREAGIEIVDSEAFYRRYDGRSSGSAAGKAIPTRKPTLSGRASWRT
jgi:hypothetical protein